jgi:hypothetical protein
MSLLDYANIEQLLLDYAAHSSPGDVVLRNARGDYQPLELLQQLSPKELKAPIVRIEGDGQETFITIRMNSWSGAAEKRFSIHWSPDRQGWAFPNGFGHSIHYFVPKNYLDRPPLCGNGVLISLCKRSFLGTTHIFRPPDPKYSVCKTCERNYHELLRQRTTGTQEA